MANESFSFEEAIGLTQKPQSGRAADSGGFSFEEALGQPAQASPGFIPTIKRTGGQMLTTAATAAEDVVGQNAVTRAVHDAGQGIIERNPAGIRSLRDLVDSPWLAVKESVGQFAPQIAAAAVGGAAGAKLGAFAGPAGAAVGSAIGAALPIVTQTYGGIRQEQQESGQEDKTRALLATVPAAALERVGMGKALKVLKGVPGGAAGTVLKEAGKGALKEGATEGAQNVIEQWGAFKDPTKGENLEDTALSAAMGGIGGGVMGGASGAVDGARRRAQERAEALAEEARRADPTSAWTTAAGAADPAVGTATGLPDVRTYGPLIEQAVEPAQQERFRNLLDSATNAELSQEQRDAAAGELHAVFSPERLEQRRRLDAAMDFTSTPGAAAPREDGLDFTRDVDTSGLGLEDPAEVERARAAIVDYEPGDAAPQWDTAAGAAPTRQPGLDMPGPDFDTSGLALDERTPSQRLGLDPAAGPLSRYAAQAVDTAAAQEAQFVAATGRDMQLRRPDPGIADDSNIIDVQGRVVDDPAIATPRWLTTDPAVGRPEAAQGGSVEPLNRSGEPLRLDMANALRNRARQAGMAASVVPHASGRGYDVVPLGGDVNMSPRHIFLTTNKADELPAPPVMATLGGAPFATRAAAQAELQRRQLASTHEVAAPGGDESLGFVLQERPQNAAPAQLQQAQEAIQTVAQRAPNWRSNALQANRVARALGLDTKSKRLAQVVAEIDAADATARLESSAAVHQEAGQPTQSATPTVVSQSMRKAAGNQDATPAQMRDWLFGEIDKAIVRAPEVAAGFVSFDVPGDGTFKVVNSSAKLREFRKRVAASPGFKEQRGNRPAGADDGSHRGSGSTVEAIKNMLADGDAHAAVEYAKAKNVQFQRVAPQLKMSTGGRARHIPASVKSTPAGVAEGLTQLEAEQLHQWLQSEAQAVSTTVVPTANAPELVAQTADAQSAGAASSSQSTGAQQQDRAQAPGPRSGKKEKRTTALAGKALAATESVADSGDQGPRARRAAAPRSDDRMESADANTGATIRAVETRLGGDGGTVLYSTSDAAPPARGLSLEQTQQAVQQALAGLRNPPPIDIVGRSEEAWVGAPEGVMGAALPEQRRIVIVASAHGSADAVLETLFHEMFHLGVRNVLPTPDYVQSMLDLAKRDSRVQRYAIEWKEKAPDAPHQLRVLRERGYTGSELTAQYEALAIEEGLAVVAEELRAQKQAGTRLGLRVRTLANWLASVAERMGMQGLAERIRTMTYNDAERFVLRAIDNAGRAQVEQRAAGADDLTRFRTRSSATAAQRVGDILQGMTVANLKQQAGFKAADYRSIGLQFLGRRQLVDVYGGMLPELRRYSDLMARMDADKNEAGAGADQLAQDWAKLTDERQLAELMHDATLAQIDPAKDFVDGDNKTDWTRLRAKYQALTPAAKEVYARARDTYRQHMRDVRAAIKERIERAEMSSERRAALLQRMDDEFFGHIKGVYFPLARFGQYLVVVKDAEGKVANVSRAEGMGEADAMRRQLLAAFPAGKGFTVGKVLKAKDFVAERDSVGRGFMEQLYGVLDKQGMDAKQRAELEDALGQLYLSSLPDLSWAKHGIHRKGTPGFSQDARRAFAQNVFHGASYLTKLRYGDRLQDELGEMQRRVDAGSADASFDSVKAQQVVDEMVKRHDAAMNPKTNAISTALTSLGFMFHLGLSPASAMVNLTQTALVAYPVMGARWGFAKSSAALLKASQQAARGRNDITASLSQDEKAAYDEAVRSGVIDVTMAHDLAGIAQGEDRNVSYKLQPVMRAASFLFHHAEKFNRQVTFVAAYRLAREAGADGKAAYQQAVQATYDGHFDYSANNRPRVMQGNVARVVLLFKQYSQNMVYTLARNAQQSLKGATPQARAEARKALGGLLVMHGMAAGVLGLPMVTTLLAAASMLGGDDDEPWDAEVALRNLLADTFGQKAGEVLAHGLSRLTPWDISGRVGLDKLIFPDVQEGLEGQRLGESAMTAALGPVAAIGINVLKGLQEMSEGRYQRGLEAMAPSVLRGPLKAWRYETEGVKDKTGIVVQDEVDAAALWGQAAGFSPSSVRNAYEGKAAIVGHDKALQARRSALVEQFAMAAMAGDEQGKAEAREAVARFNEKNPNRRILPMHLAQSVASRQKRIREAQEGVYLPAKRRDAVEQGRFATGG